MKRRSLILLVWLLLAGVGVAALFVSAGNRLAETFGTDARILHRILSQRMEQQKAVLNAVDALEKQGADTAALGTYLTTQVVAVERCTPQGCPGPGPPDRLARAAHPYRR